MLKTEIETNDSVLGNQKEQISDDLNTSDYVDDETVDKIAEDNNNNADDHKKDDKEKLYTRC